MAKEDKTKNKVGRPLKFKTEKELQKKIDAFFADCDPHIVMQWAMVKKTQKNGKVVMVPERVQAVSEQVPYTITGLAMALDTTRDTLLDYSKKEEFSDTITRAKIKIHFYAEKTLWDPKCANGMAFNLKNNWGWKDQSEVKNINRDIPTGLEDLTDEELDEYIKQNKAKVG